MSFVTNDALSLDRPYLLVFVVVAAIVKNLLFWIQLPSCCTSWCCLLLFEFYGIWSFVGIEIPDVLARVLFFS